MNKFTFRPSNFYVGLYFIGHISLPVVVLLCLFVMVSQPLRSIEMK